MSAISSSLMHKGGMSTMVFRIGRVSNPCFRAARQTLASDDFFAGKLNARDHAALPHLFDARMSSKRSSTFRGISRVSRAAFSRRRSSRNTSRLASAAAQPSWLAV